MITADHILKLSYRGMTRQMAERWAKGFNDAAQRFGINTPLRWAHFLGQVMHESCGLKYAEELWGPTPAQRGYEGRPDLGNTQPGDGLRFKGRGPIQLTGRHNYRTAGAALGLPLEQRPELAAEPENGALIAGWYWNSRNINRHADLGTGENALELVSAAINGRNRQTGKPNGMADRRAQFQRAWQLLSTTPADPYGVVLLVPSGGGKPVPWDGADSLYNKQRLRELIPQLRQAYPRPGGPWEYGGVIKFWVQQSGNMVLERLPEDPTKDIPATPPKK